MPRRMEKLVLISLMSLGGLLMWTAVPAMWVWIAGRYARVSQSDMSSFALLFVGIPATMVIVGMGLGRLERRYSDRFDVETGPRVVGARWLHSLRGDAEDEPATVLDKILIVNVALALIADTIWFALFSHGLQAPRLPSLPPGRDAGSIEFRIPFEALARGEWSQAFRRGRELLRGPTRRRRSPSAAA